MAPRKKPQKQPPPSFSPSKHHLAAAEVLVRYVRDELNDLPASLERAASHLQPDHPDALELRDLASLLRAGRLYVARAAIRLEDARNGKQEARHG